MVTTAPVYLFIARQSRNASKYNRLLSPPFLNRFTSGFHQNYLLFKGYKVSYNRKCPPLPVQFRNSQPQPLKLGRGSALLRRGAGSPSNTNSPRLRPISIPSGILMHPAVYGHNRNGPKIGRGLRPHFWGGELDSNLAQCSLDQGPPLCQVPS